MASHSCALKSAPQTTPLAVIAEGLPRLILESISDLVEVIDAQGVIVYSNLTEERRRRLGLDEVLGRRCHQVYDQVCPSCIACPLEEVLGSGRGLTREGPVGLGGGQQGWARQRLYPINGPGGAPVGVLRLVFDITGERAERAREERYLSSLEQSLHNRQESPDPQAATALSAREREVLAFLADGLSNLEIGRLLTISPNTVKTHVVHIFNKLGVNDRTQAAVTATKLALI